MRGLRRRSSLVLLELILNLFLFLVCAIVCVLLLLFAKRLSVESGELSDAVYLAQSIAEEWRATGAEPMWCTPDENGFIGSVHSGDGALDIHIYKGERLVYSLEGVKRIA